MTKYEIRKDQLISLEIYAEYISKNYPNVSAFMKQMFEDIKNNPIEERRRYIESDDDDKPRERTDYEQYLYDRANGHES